MKACSDSQSTPTNNNSAPKVIPRIGGYSVVRPLGRGSMGEVLLARVPSSPSKLVALKVFSPSSGDCSLLQKRFRNEMEILSRCDHKNLARVIECIDNEAVLAYVMEFYEGGDLGEWMRRNTTFSLRTALRILIEIAEGLAELHYHDILHRDVKPQNILLTESGGVRIADFALARGIDSSRDTEQGKVVGTLDYLSPEYLAYGAESKQCDLYALGVLAFELFSRRAPFETNGVYQEVLAKVEREAPLLSDVNASVPLEVSILVGRLLRRDPEERYKSAASVIDALRKIFDDVSVMGDVLISTHALSNTESCDEDLTSEYEIDYLQRAATNEGKVVTFPEVKLRGDGTISHNVQSLGRFGAGLTPLTGWKDQKQASATSGVLLRSSFLILGLVATVLAVTSLYAVRGLY